MFGDFSYVVGNLSKASELSSIPNSDTHIANYICICDLMLFTEGTVVPWEFPTPVQVSFFKLTLNDLCITFPPQWDWAPCLLYSLKTM